MAQVNAGLVVHMQVVQVASVGVEAHAPGQRPMRARRLARVPSSATYTTTPGAGTAYRPRNGLPWRHTAQSARPDRSCHTSLQRPVSLGWPWASPRRPGSRLHRGRPCAAYLTTARGIAAKHWSGKNRGNLPGDARRCLHRPQGVGRLVCCPTYPSGAGYEVNDEQQYDGSDLKARPC
jgi:hypothetical protein